MDQASVARAITQAEHRFGDIDVVVNHAGCYYASTKMALEGITSALRKEVGPLGIEVMAVEPGAFRTNFAGRFPKGVRNTIADYAETVGPRRKQNDRTDGTQPGSPQKRPV